MMRLFAAILLIVPMAGSADAAEEVLSLHTDIKVRADGTLDVVETIEVRAEGRKIRRGISISFAKLYRRSDGSTKVVAYDLVEILKDGKPAPHHFGSGAESDRVYIGEEDVYIPAGLYTYEVTYRVACYVAFREDYDELDWTIGRWEFPVLSSRIRVTLPDGAEISELDAFTGKDGETGKDFRIVSRSAAEFVAEATRPFGPDERLTVIGRWQKGVVTPCLLVS